MPRTNQIVPKQKKTRFQMDLTSEEMRTLKDIAKMLGLKSRAQAVRTFIHHCPQILERHRQGYEYRAMKPGETPVNHVLLSSFL